MTYEGMTWFDLVRKYFPSADEKLCTWILLVKTEYPMASPETIEKQLQAIKVLQIPVEESC